MNSRYGSGLFLGMALVLSLAGCQGSDSGYKTAEQLKKEKPPASVAKTDHDGHEHGDGHDHGHHHEAPHGGAIVMLGDHVGHLEIVLDPASGKMTAYLLDGMAENPLGIDQRELAAMVTLEHEAAADKPETPAEKPIELKLVAEGPAEAPASVFVGQADQLKGAGHFDVKIAEIAMKDNTFKDQVIHNEPAEHKSEAAK